jgi:hypothetical protein
MHTTLEQKTRLSQREKEVTKRSNVTSRRTEADIEKYRGF